MIKISDSFKTDDKRLAALYEGARSSLLGAVKPFGDYQLAVSDSDSDKITLDSEIMSAETLARYDVEKALDCVKAFALTQREDGRLACEILKDRDEIVCDYSRLTDFCFAEEALSLFYMTKKKELSYLDMLYDMFKRFDEYLSDTHDPNDNGLIELLHEKEAGEDELSARYTGLGDAAKGRSPFPIESGLMTAFSYGLKRSLACVSDILGNGEAAAYTAEADRLFENIRESFWDFEREACYDRDRFGAHIPTLTLDNLFMMCHGAFDREMADAFVKRHLLNPEEFYTELPLAILPRNYAAFSNDELFRRNSPVRSVTYRRAIRALEKYGYYTELTELSKRFISAVSESMAFTEHYDPITGAPSRKNICADYAPTASAVLEMIARFYGISVVFDEIVWGALGHEGESTSEYSYKWGGDLFTLSSEADTSSGFVNGNRLFTVTNGVRVVTDWFGNKPKVINITDRELDCVFVYRNQTFSFTLAPNNFMEF